MVSTKELQRKIEAKKKKLLEARKKELLRLQKVKLQKELLELRTRNLRKAGQKSQKFFKEAGKLVSKSIEKATPIVKKQIRLIREQQLRDDAIARRLSGNKTSTPKKRKKKKAKQRQIPKQESEIFSPLDF